MEEKKNKIKSWLRETLKSPTFLEMARKKLAEAGFLFKKNHRRFDDSDTVIDDNTMDEINLSNLINERILEEDAENSESEQLLRTLAMQQVIFNEESNEKNISNDFDSGKNIEAIVAYLIKNK